MKKFLVIIFALVLLAGCGKQTANKSQENKSAFSSIRDAINRSITLRCEYTDETGVKTTAYVRGKTIRMMDGSQEKNAPTAYNSLIKDEKLYFWTNQSAIGFVMNITALKTTDKIIMGDQVIHSTDDVIKFLEGNKTKCQAETVPDSTFELPPDIKFNNFNLSN